MEHESPSLRVLIVDDESLIRWSVAETLGAAGHAVLEAADGATALRTLTEVSDPVDVVLLDFRLPDSNDSDAPLEHPTPDPAQRGGPDVGVRDAGSHQGRPCTGRLPRVEQAHRHARRRSAGPPCARFTLALRLRRPNRPGIRPIPARAGFPACAAA